MSVPLHGQVAVSSTPTALSAVPVNSAVYTIKATATNTASVYLGASTVSTSTGHFLDPGDSFTYTPNSQHGSAALNLQVSDWYVVGNSGDHVSWVATPLS